MFLTMLMEAMLLLLLKIKIVSWYYSLEALAKITTLSRITVTTGISDTDRPRNLCFDPNQPLVKPNI